MHSLDFLRLIWAEQTGYVFLPQKGKRWAEGPAFEWPADEAKIRQHLDNGVGKDQYYCPNLFSEPERRREYVKKPAWLYADLDNVNPGRLTDFLPHVAIESSPGRFQALWRLARPIEPAKHEAYNRRLTYAIGADKGGWDLTQVLRIPGTRNHKYPGKVRVRLTWSTEGRSTLVQANKYLAGVEDNLASGDARDIPDLLLPAESPKDIRKRIWPGLDRRTRDLLGARAIPPGADLPEGRSGVLWELECRLLERGLDAEEVFVLVRDSVWNKFEDRRDGDAALWKEVQKAVLHTGRVVSEALASVNGRVTRARPRLFTYADIMSSAIREPEWGIDGYWTLGSHGIIAGLPKSYKSLVTTDMAVSLASETDFLGQFGVNPKAVGPVLIVQQENSLPLVRDRLLKVSNHRGLQTGSSSFESGDVIVFQSPPAIPILFYNDFGFDMTNHDDQEAIEILIRTEGVKTVIFDPLYLMIGGADENIAREMRPILQWLLRIRNLYNCAVLVVHHWGKTQSKGGRGVGGQRLIGSQTIYAWLEAALYLEAHHYEDGGTAIVMEREFRERAPSAPAVFNLTLGDVGDLAYGWDTTGPISSHNKLLEALNNAGPQGATLIGLRQEMNWGQKKMRKELDTLIDNGFVEERQDGRVKRFFLTSQEYTDGEE